jgi:hypothetical protein
MPTTPSEAGEAGEARETQNEEPEETKALEGEILSFIDEIRLLNEVKSLRR